MKSKTVKWNIFTLLTTLALIFGYYQNIVPGWASTAMMIGGILISQAITYFTPSGEFVGHGQNWIVGKWITRIGLSVIAIFELTQNSFGWAMVLSSITPLIEIIIRMYGSATPEQKAAA